MRRAVVVRFFSRKIGDNIVAIGETNHGKRRIQLAEGALNQPGVRGIVFDEQNWSFSYSVPFSHSIPLLYFVARRCEPMETETVVPYRQEKPAFSYSDLRSAVCAVCRGAAGSSIQKVLPFPKSDSTPQLPCMRPTARFTIARPMPVPGYASRSCNLSNTCQIRSWC